MACFFGSSENTEKLNELKSQITSLKKDIIRLQQENTELRSSADSIDESDNDDENNASTSTSQHGQREQLLKENQSLKAKLQAAEFRARAATQQAETTKRETEQLRARFVQLEQEKNAILTSNNIDTTITEQLQSYKQKCQALQTQTEQQQNEIEALQAEKQLLTASQKMLQQKDKLSQSELTRLRQELQAQTNASAETDEKTAATPTPKEATNDESVHLANTMNTDPKRKYNMNRLEDQIEVLLSEKARSESLLLCCKPQYVERADQERENFTFLRFLETSLSEKVVKQLFKQFKSDTVDGKQFTSLLTLTVIVYQVKLHQHRTGSREKPDLDSSEIRRHVEHLSAWIIRTYGRKTNEKVAVSLVNLNDSRMNLNGEYSVYECAFDKEIFKQQVKNWVFQYVNNDGLIHLE